MSFAGLANKVETNQKNTQVSLDSLKANPNQIRSSMDTDEIKEQVDQIKNRVLSGKKIEDRLVVEPILDEFNEIKYPEEFNVLDGHNRQLGLLLAREEAISFNKANPDKEPKHYYEDIDVVIRYNLTDKEKREIEYLANRGVRTHILDEALYIVNWANEDGLEECLAITGLTKNKFSEYKRLNEGLEPELRQLLIDKNIRTPQTIRDIKKQPDRNRELIIQHIKAGTFKNGFAKKKVVPELKITETIDTETNDIVVVKEIIEDKPKPKKVNSISVNRQVMAHILKELKGQTINPDSDEIIAEFKQFVEDVKQKEIVNNEK